MFHDIESYMLHASFNVNYFSLLILDFFHKIEIMIPSFFSYCSDRATIILLMKVWRIMAVSAKHRVKSLTSASLGKSYCMQRLLNMMVISVWPRKQNWGENEAECRLPLLSIRYFTYKIYFKYVKDATYQLHWP